MTAAQLSGLTGVFLLAAVSAILFTDGVFEKVCGIQTEDVITPESDSGFECTAFGRQWKSRVIGLEQAVRTIQ